MKIQVTLTHTYEVDETSERTLAAYGTQNPAEIIAVDRDQFMDDLVLLADHIIGGEYEYELTMRQI